VGHGQRPGPVRRLQELRAEVSPYITECPYCGNALRKRAPKLERGGAEGRQGAAQRPSLAALRRGRCPGSAASGGPYATIALSSSDRRDDPAQRSGVLARRLRARLRASPTSGGGSSRRCSSTATGYEIVRLARSSCSAGCSSAGTGRGRRCWSSSPAARGMALACSPATPALALGAQRRRARAAVRLGDARLLGRRRGEEDDSDMLGVLAIAVVLLCCRSPRRRRSAVAGVGRRVIGLVLGLPLARHARALGRYRSLAGAVASGATLRGQRHADGEGLPPVLDASNRAYRGLDTARRRVHSVPVGERSAMNRPARHSPPSVQPLRLGGSRSSVLQRIS
jgi:hypothetical protein